MPHTRESGPPQRTAVWVAQVAAGSLLLVGLLAGGWAAAQLGLWRDGVPGPGLWPLVAAVTLMASSIVVLVEAGSSDDYEPFRGVWRVIGACGLLVVFTVLFAATGLVPASLVLLTAWLRFLSGELWMRATALAAAITAALYLIFVVALQVPVPAVTLPMGW